MQTVSVPLSVTKVYEGSSTFAYESTAPILKIPEEILNSIFTLACGNQRIKIGTQDDQLWILREVSSRWRSVIDLTPTLWNRWMIHYPVELSESIVVIRTQLCIENSKALPLYVSITEDVSLFPFHLGKWTESLRRVISSNIVHLSQHCADLQIPVDLLKAVTSDGLYETKWPKLQKLSLNWGEITSSIFRGMEALQELKIHRGSILETEDFHLSQVKKLTFDFCRVASPESRIYGILKTAPLLEELAWINSDIFWNHLRTHDAGPVMLTVEKPLMLQHLHTLRLHSRNFSVTDYEIFVAPMICAPYIRTLDLNVCPNAAKCVAELARRSNFNIKRLELSSTHLTDIKDLMQDFHRDIEELCLTDCSRDSSYDDHWDSSESSDDDDADDTLCIYALHAMHYYSLWMPSLQKLELYQKGSSQFSLLNFIKNRYTPGKWDNVYQEKKQQLTPLKYLKYSTVNHPDDEREMKLMEELNSLGRECGFEVVTEILGRGHI